MRSNPVSIRLCGFGGQGIILSAVILGTAAVTKRGLYAVQTQSYGSEARGGECQAELIISDQPINSPMVDKKDLLIALSQNALNRYLSSLRPGGTLIIDPQLVKDTHGSKEKTISVPATETAVRLGNRISANMVILGFLQESTGLLTKEDLVTVIEELTRPRFLDINLRAVDEGIEFARGVTVEV
jgi:2-oxoglutarate ferredoxin oxidoreductase subunit gamma